MQTFSIYTFAHHFYPLFIWCCHIVKNTNSNVKYVYFNKERKIENCFILMPVVTAHSNESLLQPIVI